MKKVPLLAGLLLGGASPAFAEINFNGFASVYAGYFDSEAEGGARELQGYSESFDFKQGSLAALQFTADLEDGLTATAQIVARGEDSFDPEMEWAFLGYQFNDTWKINVGRIRIPLFQYSDYLDVGYAYHWGQVPDLVYNSVPISSFDGFNVIADYSAGNWDFSGNIFSNGDKFWGLNWQASSGNFAGRVIYAINETTVPIPPAEAIAGVLNQFGYSQAAEDVRLNEDSHSFAGLSLSYDTGSWFVVGEYTMSDWDPSWISNTDAGFVSGGMRFGEWTPHLTYSFKESTPILDALDSIPDDALAGPPPASPTLDSVVGGFLETFAEEKTEIIAGVRYDFHAAAALKLDVVLHTDDLDEDNDGTLFRLGVDMVF